MRELRALTEARERLAERVPRRLLGLAGGHVAIIAVVLALAVAAAAVLVVRSRPVAEAVPDVSGQTRLTSASGPAAESAAEATAAPSETAVGSSSDPTASGRMFVHVAGKVRDPGVIELPAGSRVLDAIEAAGGARDGVKLREVNLARVLSDGEQVLVGIPQESGAPPAAQPDGGDASEPAEQIDLNTATAEQLETLPGIGPVLAERLVDYRTEHGRFSSIDELLDVSGIGEATFADLEPRVTVGR